MKKILCAVAAGASLLALAAAPAVAVPVVVVGIPGEVLPLSPGLVLRIGDKVFNFTSCSETATGSVGAADCYGANALQITPISNLYGIGFSLSGNISAAAGSANVHDFQLRYTVAVDPGHVISDAHLALVGTGRYFASEVVTSGGFSVTSLNASQSTTSADDFCLGDDSLPGCAGYNFVTVRKDFGAIGSLAGVPTASSLTSVDQVFSQLPEPATLLIFAGALAGLGGLRRRPIKCCVAVP